MANDCDDILTDNEGDSLEDDSNALDACEDNYVKPYHPIIRYMASGGKRPVLCFHAIPRFLTPEEYAKVPVGRYRLGYKMIKTESKLVRGTLAYYGFREVHPNSNDFNLMWTGSHVKPYSLRSLNEFQKINHFPRSYEITRKDKLAKNVLRMRQLFGARHFDYVPASFELPNEFNDFYAEFLKCKSPWIIKPMASSRGRGITVVNNINQVPLDEPCIISKYVNNPLCIDGFKFDLRIYITVTSFDPMRVYIYNEGLTRFATEKYDPASSNLENNFMHLTNYSINKKSENFVNNTDADVDDYGNKWSLSALLRYLRDMGKDTTSMMLQVEDIIIKTLISVEGAVSSATKMFVPHANNCFELFGFDILIDDTLRPWLLEVNLSPSLACDAPLDLKIKSTLIADTFSLVGVSPYDTVKYREAQRRRSADMVRGGLRRPSSSSLGPSSRSRPSSAKSTSDTKSRYADLSLEERRMLRQTLDEEQRMGGFMRIFPTADTWSTYAHFFEGRPTSNGTIHQRLFPRLYDGNMRRPTSSSGIRRPKRSSSAPLNGSLENYNSIAHILDSPSAQLRCREYERKTIVGLGSYDDDDLDRLDGDSSVEVVRGNGNHRSASLGLNNGIRVDDLMSDGVELNPTQARDAFSVYLERVQLRLQYTFSMESPSDRNGFSSKKKTITAQEFADQEEQMLLIIRFLKRAAANLPPPGFRVIVPSKRLVVRDRQHILAKQLSDFIRIYRQETDRLQLHRRLDVNVGIDKERFETFICNATESELEELLSKFTKLNNSPDIFLGGNVNGNGRLMNTGKRSSGPQSLRPVGTPEVSSIGLRKTKKPQRSVLTNSYRYDQETDYSYYSEEEGDGVTEALVRLELDSSHKGAERLYRNGSSQHRNANGSPHTSNSSSSQADLREVYQPPKKGSLSTRRPISARKVSDRRSSTSTPTSCNRQSNGLTNRRSLPLPVFGSAPAEYGMKNYTRPISARRSRSSKGCNGTTDSVSRPSSGRQSVSSKRPTYISISPQDVVSTPAALSPYDLSSDITFFGDVFSPYRPPSGRHKSVVTRGEGSEQIRSPSQPQYGTPELRRRRNQYE